MESGAENGALAGQNALEEVCWLRGQIFVNFVFHLSLFSHPGTRNCDMFPMRRSNQPYSLGANSVEGIVC